MERVNKKQLGDRIRELRTAAGHTQDDLAELLEQKRQVVSYYENGTRTPNIEQIMTIAKEYNTTTDYLLGLTDVATTDKDIQFVCDYTGLNLLAVENLHNPVKKHPFYDFDADERYREIKSNLLSNEKLFLIINRFVLLSNQFIKLQHQLIELDEELNNITDIENYREKVREIYKCLRLIKSDLYDNEKQLNVLLENSKGFNYDDLSKANNLIIEILKELNKRQYGIDYDEQ